MFLIFRGLFWMFLCFSGSAVLCARHAARMTFTGEEASIQVSDLPEPLDLVILEADPDVVTVIGQRTLTSLNLRSGEQKAGKITWEGCDGLCNDIYVAQPKQGGEKAVVCGPKGSGMYCCELNLRSEDKWLCRNTEQLRGINLILSRMPLKKNIHSILVESPDGDNLFATYSGFQDYVGLHKIGLPKVGPPLHDKEQYYKGMMLSRHEGDSLQDKIYAFYNDKNLDKEVPGRMWTPYVTQVCVADQGGKKNELQFAWTSQLTARIFCGDSGRKWSFFELVDVATVHAAHWEDTTIYALFRNEWSVSAVCVYTVGDIDQVFRSSPFRSATLPQEDRVRECVKNSKELSSRQIKMVSNTIEVEDWVRPAKNSGPVFTNHQNYTHIYVDTGSKYPVLFLSLHDGGVHKVVPLGEQSFVIAEYRPFGPMAKILSIMPHPTESKLYVGSSEQLAVLDRATCGLYGDTCQQCVLARDPQCGWDGRHCTADTQNTMQEVMSGNHSVCGADRGRTGKLLDDTLPAGARYFLECPKTSHLASYSWTHEQRPLPCPPGGRYCLHLIPSMSAAHEGLYRCVSREAGYERVLVEHRLRLAARAPGMSPGALLCLAALLLSLVVVQL